MFSISLPPSLQDLILLYDDGKQKLLANAHLPVQHILPLSEEDYNFLYLCDGQHPLGDLAKTLNLSEDKVKERIEYWEKTSPGLFRPSEDFIKQIQFLQQIGKVRSTYQAAVNADSVPDNITYHHEEIKDSFQQFTEVETTLSHIYRSPSEALGGQSYGESLCKKVMEMGPLGKGAAILEIGGGTGLVAKNFLDCLKGKFPQIYENITYTIFDVSPALQSSQNKICENHLSRMNFILGDIHTYDFKGRTFDFILANEMIADLEISVTFLENIRNQTAQSEGEKKVLLYKFDTSNAPPKYVVNTGAIRLIEKLPELLNKNCWSLITEYGTEMGYPLEVKLGGHSEFSIRYDDLQKVASSLFLKTSLESMATFFPFNLEVKLLSRPSFKAMKLLRSHLGLERQYTEAFTEEVFAKTMGEFGKHLKNLHFRPIKEHREILTPYSFLALSIWKS